MIAVGEKVPDVALKAVTSEGTQDVRMLADDAAAFTSAMGLATDASGFGLGTRSERYAAIIENGVLTSLEVEEQFVDHEVSTAEHVLAAL